MKRPSRRPALVAALSVLGLLCGCGHGSDVAPGETASLSADATGVAEEQRPTATGRLDFLRAQDAHHAFVLDSSFHTDVMGLEPLDPPWVAGKNQLTVLRVDDGQLALDGAVPLGDWNMAYTFQLSPDGDTALVGVWDEERGPRVLVVRGLGDGTGHVAQDLPAPSELVTFAFSPDGRKALVGYIVFAGETLHLRLLAGLPDAAYYEGVIDTGVFVDFQAHVDSLDVGPDGTVAVAKNIFCKDRSHQPGSSDAAVQVISHPFDLARVRASEPLWPSPISVYPPPPPYEGTASGFPMGDIMLVGDGETAVLPITGYVGTAVSIPLADARILLIQGVRSGQPYLARTLGPEDGVEPFPMQLALAPGRNELVVANFAGESLSLLGGLGDPTLQDLRIATRPVGRFVWEPAITPDGRTLLVSAPRAPVDGGLPAEVWSHALEEDRIGPILDRESEDVHVTYVWIDANCQTWPPGVADHVRALTRHLPPGIGAGLVDLLDAAAEAADGGHDLLARLHLWQFERGVEDLVGRGDLAAGQARVLHAGVTVALERLASGD